MESLEVIDSKDSHKGYISRKRFTAALCVVGLLVVLLIIFIGLYAGQVSQGKNTATAKKSHTQTTSGTSTGTSTGTNTSTSTGTSTGTSTMKVTKTKDVCETTECINQASHMLKSMDTSVDPCDDFYQYACGSWPKNYPLNPKENFNSIIEEMTYKIDEMLEVMLGNTWEKYREVSAQKKVKQFFNACMFSFGRMLNSGKSLLNKIINPTGDWFLLKDGWNESNWSMADALGKTYADFQTAAMFKVTLEPTKNGQMAIHIGVGDTRSYSKFHSRSYPPLLAYYKTYIAKVMKLIVEDNGIVMDQNTFESRLKIFTDDVILVEKFITKNITSIFRWNPTPMTVTLANLNVLLNNVTNFTQIMQYTFPGAGITSETSIVIEDTRKVTPMVDFMQDLDNKQIIKRVSNNYIVWRLIEEYLQDLSWPYIHAQRQLYFQRTSLTKFISSYDYCLSNTKEKMSDVLSHLFIKNYFIKENKKKVGLLVKYLNKGATATVFDMAYLNNQSKEIIKEIIHNKTYHLGYTDWMEDSNAINNRYLSVNLTDNHLDNLLRLNKLLQARDVELLKKGSKDFDWAIWRPYIMMSRGNNIYVSAALLQTPLYNHHAPSFANFGGVGGELAYRIFLEIVDKITAGPNPWDQFRLCLMSNHIEVVEGPFLIKGVQKYVNYTTKSYGLTELKHIFITKIAYQAYLALERDHGVEKGLPGLKSLSNHQLLFLSLMQLKCQSRSDWVAYREAMSDEIPTKLALNQAMWNLPEFHDVFKCKQGTTMNPAKKCLA